jgi:hypothetical protein
MRPAAYAEYLRLISEYMANGRAQSVPGIFEEAPSNSIVLTLKNYGTRRGLSSSLSDPLNSHATYKVKGPMGPGIGI